MKVAAIIPAAGQGKRMGKSGPKQFLQLQGRTILAHTLEVFFSVPEVTSIYLMVPEDELEAVRQEWGRKPRVQVILGGKERQDSVANGLDALDEDTEIVVVHDGVRPFVSREMIINSIAGAQKYGAVAAAVPVNDTIKKADGDGFVVDGVNRDGLWRMQTPQTFRYRLLFEAIEKARRDAYYGTDEVSLVERLGTRVKIIPGAESNIKITRPEDLLIARALLSALS